MDGGHDPGCRVRCSPRTKSERDSATMAWPPWICSGGSRGWAARPAKCRTNPRMRWSTRATGASPIGV